MEHKGFEYQVVLAAIPDSGWKWIVYLSAEKTKSGVASSKEIATQNAIRLIDKTAKEAEPK
jgi:hypothetical protein